MRSFQLKIPAKQIIISDMKHIIAQSYSEWQYKSYCDFPYDVKQITGRTDLKQITAPCCSHAGTISGSV